MLYLFWKVADARDEREDGMAQKLNQPLVRKPATDCVSYMIHNRESRFVWPRNTEEYQEYLRLVQALKNLEVD